MHYEEYALRNSSIMFLPISNLTKTRIFDPHKSMVREIDRCLKANEVSGHAKGVGFFFTDYGSGVLCVMTVYSAFTFQSILTFASIQIEDDG